MRLEVPFYKQETNYDCGATALQMVLEYLSKEKYPRDKLQDLVDSDKSGVTWTIGLAKSASQLGFKTELYTKSLGFNPKNYELEFYQKLADESSLAEKKTDRLKLEAVKFNVKMEERIFSLDELLGKITKDCVPIVLLDWSKIKGTDKFIGHFVPITGYDNENIYVHNQGGLNAQANFPIRRELFEESRKSPGTDEDIIFIYRRSQNK